MHLCPAILIHSLLTSPLSNDVALAARPARGSRRLGCTATGGRTKRQLLQPQPEPAESPAAATAQPAVG